MSIQNSQTKWTLVGKVKEAHGLAGDLFIFLFSKQADWIKKTMKIQLKKENIEREFSIRSIRAQHEGIILGLEGISNRNESELLKGYLFSVPSDIFISKKNERIFLSEILNFSVFDHEKYVGKIKSFSSNGPQDLLVVAGEKQSEIEIPFVEAFILDIDFQNQKVNMLLPEGLLEVNVLEEKKK